MRAARRSRHFARPAWEPYQRSGPGVTGRDKSHRRRRRRGGYGRRVALNSMDPLCRTAAHRRLQPAARFRQIRRVTGGVKEFLESKSSFLKGAQFGLNLEEKLAESSDCSRKSLFRFQFAERIHEVDRGRQNTGRSGSIRSNRRLFSLDAR